MKLRAIWLALAALVIARPIEAHPLHTSLAEITWDPAAKEIRVSVRVFVDDFSKAAATFAGAKALPGTGYRAPGTGYRVPGTGHRVPDGVSPLLVYARATFMVADRGGRVLSLA